MEATKPALHPWEFAALQRVYSIAKKVLDLDPDDATWQRMAWDPSLSDDTQEDAIYARFI